MRPSKLANEGVLVTIEDLYQRYDSDCESYKSSDAAHTSQDIAAFGQHEINDMQPTIDVLWMFEDQQSREGRTVMPRFVYNANS